MTRTAIALGVVAVCAALVGCRDLARFSSAGDRFEGSVVPADFVRAGFDSSVTLCLSLDSDHLQDAPGTISTSDGRFSSTPLRPIPQLWHDPLSTYSFGDGREKNLLYVATPSPSDAGGDAAEVMVFLSLMTNGGVEARLVRGAPAAPSAASSSPSSPQIFAVFQLDRREGRCSY